jgi:hypothetical protein
LLELFLPIIPANNLQGVLDYGNTATQDINLFGTITTTNLDVTDTANLFITYLNEETHLVGSLFDSADSVGTAGQVLTSTGDGVEWFTLPPIFTPNLEQVLTEGNTSSIDILLDANLEALDVSADTATVGVNLTLGGTITDNSSAVGSAGQVLSSTVTGVAWISLPVYSATSPLLFNSATGVFSIQVANSTQGGYLTANDWVTFDGKQNAGAYITALTGEATASGPGSAAVTLNNASVTGKVLTGLNVTGGNVVATDSILTAFGKVQNQINGLVGGVQYQGVWDAATNTPTLTSSVGTQGHYYIVNVAGNTNLNGITDWQVGDWAIFSGGVWQKVDNTDSVTSVNGQTGAVSLTTDNIPEGTTNLYYLDSRARAALSFVAGSGAYNNTTGVITIPTNNNQILNGANYIVLGSLSANSPLSYNNTTGAFSIQVANSTQNGYLSSTDWNTFNNKQGTITLTTTGSSGPSTLVGTTLNIPDYGGALTGYVPYTGATGPVNLGAYDLTVQTLTIGKGNSSLSNNTALGYRALFHITTGNYNTAVGYESSHNTTTGQYNTSLGQSALFTNTTGSQNTAIGLNALLYNLTGGSNVVVGLDAMQHNTSGSSNTALGYNAGSHITGGTTPNTAASNGVYIGRDTRAKVDGGTNEIVIGNAVTGNGSNTVTIGNSSIVDNYFTGSIHGGSFIRLGGTASQFLKANGSIDSSAYIVLGSLSASAPLSYNNTTGAFSISQSGTATDGYLSSTDWNTFNNKQSFITAGTTAQYYRGDKTFQTLDTTVVPEGTNLYYLDSRARAAISLTTTGSSGAATYNSTTGVFNIPNYSDALTGYVPTSRQLTINGTAYDLSADRTWSVGTVTSVAALTLGTTGTDLSSSVATGTTTPVITLNVPTASAANRGALSAADWSTFNTKVGAVTATSPLFSSGGSIPNITIQQSSGSQAGFLSAADWTTFNNKQAAGNYITSLTGEATGTGPGATAVTLNNASVTAKILTGINITGGTVQATDTMLTAFGKLQNQINGLIGSTIYQGTWNASTNTPALASGVGVRGYYYIVSVAGNTNLDGITDWFVGDWAIFDGTAWQQVDNTDAVVSVNGQTGAVSLTTDNIPEGSTNLYYLDSRARAALSFTAGSGAYNSTTGVITIPTNTSQLTNGANFITLASLSGTAPIVYSNTTGAISITQSGTASNGFLSSTDWNTFNNKASTADLANYLPLAGGIMTGQIVLKEGTDSTDYSKGLRFPTDPYGGGGDVSGLRLYRDGAGTEKIVLELYVGNDIPGAAQDRINFRTGVGGTPNNDLVTINDNIIWNAGNLPTPQSAITLTTTGSSGVATLIGSTLNIPNYGSALSGYVPYTGATTNLNLGVNNLLLGSGNTGAYILMVGIKGQNYIDIENAGARNVFQMDSIVHTSKQFGGTKSIMIQTSAVTGNDYVISFPDASGTVALTSQIPSLTGYVNTSGSPTNNYIPKFTGASTIGNSLLKDDGTRVYNTSTNTTTFVNYGDFTTSNTNGLGVDMNGVGYSFSLFFAYGIGDNGRTTIGSWDGTTYRTKFAVLGSGATLINTQTDDGSGAKLQVNGSASLLGDITLTNTYPRINFVDTDNNPDWSIINANGQLSFYDITNNIQRLVFTSAMAYFTGPTNTDVDTIAANGSVGYNAGYAIYKGGTQKWYLYSSGSNDTYNIGNPTNGIALIIAQTNAATFTSTLGIGGTAAASGEAVRITQSGDNYFLNMINNSSSLFSVIAQGTAVSGYGIVYVSKAGSDRIILNANGESQISAGSGFSSSGNYGLYVSNGFSPSSGTFNNGGTWAASNNYQAITWGSSSVTVNAGAVIAGFNAVNRNIFNTSGVSINVIQASSGIRAVSAFQILQQTGGTNAGTISHGASMFIQGIYPTNTSTTTFTNYYGLLINALDEWQGSLPYISITNRYGIYQAGGSDKNYFAGQSTFNSGLILPVNQSITSNGGRILLNNGSIYIGDIDNVNPSGALNLRQAGNDVLSYNNSLLSITGKISLTSASGAEIAKFSGPSGQDNFLSVYSGSIQMFIDADNTNSAGISGTQSAHPYFLRASGTNRVKINTTGSMVLVSGGDSGGRRFYNYDGGAGNQNGLGLDMGGNSYEYSLFFAYGVSESGRTSIGSYDGTTYRTKMTIYGSGNIGAPTGSNIYNASDFRLKKNIVTLSNGIDTILGLNPVKFNWLDNYVKDENNKDLLGFIAQEVVKIIPEAVESFSDGSDIILADRVVKNPLRVNEKFIIPYLVKAIQEQQKQINELKNK